MGAMQWRTIVGGGIFISYQRRERAMETLGSHFEHCKYHEKKNLVKDIHLNSLIARLTTYHFIRSDSVRANLPPTSLLPYCPIQKPCHAVEILGDARN